MSVSQREGQQVSNSALIPGVCWTIVLLKLENRNVHPTFANPNWIFISCIFKTKKNKLKKNVISFTDELCNNKSILKFKIILKSLN